jgi:hypothetical protein
MWSRRQKPARTLEEQLVALRRQIEAAEAEMIEREAELIELRVEMSAFQLEYDVHIGRKLDALAEIEALIGRCKQRIETYRQWGPQGPPRARDGSEYVSVEEQYRRTWRDPPPPAPPPPPRPLGAVAEQELKSLYRKLCHRFHPDLTQDPDERTWRTEMMAAVNAAYAAQSLTELQALATRPGHRAVRDGKADRHRLDALRDKLRHIQRRIREIERELDDLMHGAMIELSVEVKLAKSRGHDLLAAMAAEVDGKTERKRAELDFMHAQLKQLGIECE